MEKEPAGRLMHAPYTPALVHNTLLAVECNRGTLTHCSMHLETCFLANTVNVVLYSASVCLHKDLMALAPLSKQVSGQQLM